MTPEIKHYLEFFQDLHGQIDALLQTLSLEAVNWQPIANDDDHSTNSIAALLMHVTGAEQFWIGELLGGREINRDRDAEFVAVATGIASLQDRLRQTSQLTKEILSSIDPVRLDESVQVREHTLTLRWGIIHMIEHAAMHLGHMQLTAQLWQNQRPT